MKRILIACFMALALVTGAQAQDEAKWKAALEAGTAAYRRGGYEEATRHFETALLRAEAFGADNARVATSLAWLTEMYRIQRRYLDAERLIRRAIQIDEQTHGPEHTDVAMSLNSLALLFHSQGRLAEVEAPLTRALLIFQKVLGPEHPRVATNLHNLGSLYRSMGRDADAVPLYQRAFELRAKSLGASHRDTTLSRDALAATEAALRSPPVPRTLAPAVDVARSKPVAPAIAPPAPPPAPIAAALPPAVPQAPVVTAPVVETPATPAVVVAPPAPAAVTAPPAPAAVVAPPAPAVVVAVPAAAVAPPAPAVVAPSPHTSVAVAPTPSPIVVAPRPAPIIVAPSGPVSRAAAPAPAPAPAQLARAAAAPPATAPSRESVVSSAPAPAQDSGPTRDIIIAPAPRVVRAAPAVAVAAATPAARSAPPAAARPAPAVVAAVAPRAPAPPQRAAPQAHRSSLALHLGLLAASNAQGASARTAFEVMQQSRNRRVKAAPQRAAERLAGGDEALAGVVRARKELLARWQTLDRALVAASSRLATGEAQRLRDELAAVDREVAVQEAVIARHLPRWLEHFSPEVMSLGTAQALLAPEEALLSYIVDDGGSYLVALRRDRSAFLNLDIGRAELATLVRRVRDQLDPLSHSGPHAVRRPFPVDLSVRLYRTLIAPVEALLVGASHLIVVPDDVLESLPFGLLASAPPAKPLRVPADHAQVAWLARQFALSSVPSEGSLRALRRGGRTAAGTRPFSGWGDPVLRARAPRAVTARGGRGLTRFNARREPTPLAREVARLDALPESRDVLFAIADVLRATDDDLHLREDATESALKRAELAGYGILAFATWGLNAESLDTLDEPALVFTPPERAGSGDDGFLTASEIAVLRLNADLVILPATRTAGADGAASREGVSELARGFLHAGARTLLAAHWPVTADSTLKLTTRMLREQALGAGKAEALRRAMLMLANGEDRYEYAHPVYWAALAVIGEGGYAAATPVTTAITTGRPDPGERSIHPVLPGTAADQAPAVPADTPATESGVNVFEGAGRLLRGILGGGK